MRIHSVLIPHYHLITSAFALAALALSLAPVLHAAPPSPRYAHTAIWTGSEMVVWGGSDASGNPLNDGGRYDPRTHTWKPMTMVNAPAGRFNHTALWTGTDMIIWGGRSGGFNFLSEGWFYNPALDLWSPMNQTGQPTPRNAHSAVWTGSQMIIWGGADGNLLNSGGRHQLPAETWSVVTTNSAPSPRTTFSTVWTGSRMVIWGGASTLVQGPFANGGRYDPTADNWSPVSLLNAPAARYGNATAWTGSEMFIWSGYDGASFLTDGRRYHAASDMWLNLSTVGAPSSRASATTIFTDNEVIVWGGGTTVNTNTGGRYSVNSGTWTATSTNGAPAARAQHTAVWSGSEMIVFGGRNNGPVFGDVARYNPAIDSWTIFRPGVLTSNANNITSSSAQLRGIAVPNNTNTSAWFEWGTTTNYGNRTAAQNVGSGTNSTNFTHITAVTANQLYHFRAVASNSVGLAYGIDKVFTTVVPLYSEDFDVDHTANWQANMGPGTNAANFFFDYSTIGIPPAPNSEGTTRGLKLEANYRGQIFGGLSVSPLGQNFTSDYMLQFDIWWNYIMGVGEVGTTQFTGAGVGTAGASAQWSGGPKDSVYFVVTGDGGGNSDYRAYSTAAMNGYATGDTVYAAPGGNTDSTSAYYAALGENTVPAAQTAVDQYQVGTSPPGAPAFRWHVGKIIKRGNAIAFSIDDLLIATIDTGTVTLSGGNILFNQFDVNANSPPVFEEDLRRFQFGLIDNVRVVSLQPRFLNITQLGDGSVQLTGLGLPGWQYSVSVTNQLGAITPQNWAGTNIGATIADPNGIINFHDPAAAEQSQRYYRLRTP